MKKYYDDETQRWVYGEREQQTFPIKVRKKGCAECTPKTPEEHREALKSKETKPR